MNDEPTSSTAARSENSPDVDPSGADSAMTGGADTPKTFSQKARRKRVDFLNDVLHWLDLVIYMELASIYCMDNSFFRFFLFASIQFVLLTPKPASFPDSQQPKAYIGAILGINAICFFTRLYFPREEAGESTRFYMHGGLLIDFIGQKSPTSNFHLVLLDLLVVTLQLVMLAATIKRRDLRNALTQSSGAVGSRRSSTVGTSSTRQDHDAEERGMLRRSSVLSGIGELETEGLLATTSAQDAQELRPAREVEVLDTLISGQANIASFYIIDTVREQYLAYQNRPATSSSPATFDSEVQRRLARNVLYRLANRRPG